MNIALVFAGGVGRRMNSKSTPKQFLEVHGKPIIIHTLENFENHPEIDAICLVIVKTHLDYMKRLCDKFSLSKVAWIVAGGSTGQQSIFNGLKEVYANSPHDSIILIHDGVRPNITDSLISQNIHLTLTKGSAISCAMATETHAHINKEGEICQIADRSDSVIAKAPQSFVLEDIYSSHLLARDEQLEFIDSGSLMKHYGYTLNMVASSWENIKVTNPSDFYIFRAILESKENSQIFGL